MIFIQGFPLAPSVNQYLMPVVGRIKINKKTGRKYRGASWVKTDTHRKFEEECHIWKYKNHASFKRSFDELQILKKQKLLILKIEIYFVFHKSRIWKSIGGFKKLDTDNRLKPCLDAISKLFEIDDSHFFAVSCEKVTCDNKEDEGAYIYISPTIPKMGDFLGKLRGTDARPENTFTQDSGSPTGNV